jgi:hypothetical protein
MSRYRRVSLRMNADARYRRLSDPQPCGKFLWHHLLFGPHTGIIPGLSVAGEAQLAEAIGWPLKGFREAFQEVFREGMAEADWGARVIWLSKAIAHNPPASPNVIKSWREAWEEIPECALKVKAYQTLKAFTEGMGKGFAEAFVYAFGKDIPESGAGTGAVTEARAGSTQEPPYSPPVGPVAAPAALVSDRQVAAPRRKRAPAAGGHLSEFAEFWAIYPRHESKDRAVKAWLKTAPLRPPLEDLLAILVQQKRTIWRDKERDFIPHASTWLNGRRWEDETGTDNGRGTTAAASPTTEFSQLVGTIRDGLFCNDALPDEERDGLVDKLDALALGDTAGAEAIRAAGAAHTAGGPTC